MSDRFVFLSTIFIDHKKYFNGVNSEVFQIGNEEIVNHQWPNHVGIE